MRKILDRRDMKHMKEKLSCRRSVFMSFMFLLSKSFSHNSVNPVQNLSRPFSVHSVNPVKNSVLPLPAIAACMAGSVW